MIHFHDFKKNAINCEIFLVFSRPLNLRDVGILRSGRLEKREKKKREKEVYFGNPSLFYPVVKHGSNSHYRALNINTVNCSPVTERYKSLGTWLRKWAI